MGGTSSSETRQQSTTKNDPWYMSIPQLQQVHNFVAPQWEKVGPTGNEQAALEALQKNASEGNPYAPAISHLAADLFNGGPDRTAMVSANLEDMRRGLTPYTTATVDPWENADFRRMADDMQKRVSNQVNGTWAASGRDVSPGNARALSEGITSALAPMAWQASNDLHNRRIGAINTVYGAGNTTAGILAGLDQAALANRVKGVDVARSAMLAKDSPYVRMLELEAQRRGLPLQNIAALENIILPMAQLGGTSFTDSFSKTTKQASPMEIAQGWASTGAKLFTPAANGTTPWQNFWGSW